MGREGGGGVALRMVIRPPHNLGRMGSSSVVERGGCTATCKASTTALASHTNECGSRSGAQSLHVGSGPDPTKSLSLNLAPNSQGVGGEFRRWGEFRVGQPKCRCSLLGLFRQLLFFIATFTFELNS